jgi:hypothetical protein
MEDRRHKGLCYNCDDPFIHGHRCKKLFMLQISSDSDNDKPTNDVGCVEQPQISLLALSGIRSSQTMQLHVTIGGASLTTLVDTGSTQNFVASKLTERVGLTVRKRARLCVAVTNGDRITSDGIYCNTPIIIDQEAFSLDFYAIPLGRCAGSPMAEYTRPIL